jgi:hypothetical protein
MRGNVGIAGIVLAGAIVAMAPGESRGQFTVGIDPPSYVPGRGMGYGVNTYGYGGMGRRGAGYWTPLPDIGYYAAGTGPGPFYSPVFNAMPAAPRDRQPAQADSRYAGPGTPVSMTPPAGARSAAPRRGLLNRLFRGR